MRKPSTDRLARSSLEPHSSKLAKRYEIAMSQSGNDRRIDYVELAVSDIARARDFYGQAFGWTFKDYGPDYCEFGDGRLTGGFAKADAVTPRGGPLVILYADDLEDAQRRIETRRRAHRQADLQLPRRPAPPFPRPGRLRIGGLVRQVEPSTHDAGVVLGNIFREPILPFRLASRRRLLRSRRRRRTGSCSR